MWTQTLWLYSCPKILVFDCTLYSDRSCTGISLITSLLSRDLQILLPDIKANELFFLKTFIMYISFTLANVILSKILDYIATIISLKDNDQSRYL